MSHICSIYDQSVQYIYESYTKIRHRAYMNLLTYMYHICYIYDFFSRDAEYTLLCLNVSRKSRAKVVFERNQRCFMPRPIEVRCDNQSADAIAGNVAISD